MINKLEESMPVFFMCLFKVLELALNNSTGATTAIDIVSIR